MGVKNISFFAGVDFQKATAKLETEEEFFCVENWRKVTMYVD